MGKEDKKYLIKESELKEIIQEMMLMELFNPDDYNGMHTPGYEPGSAPMPKDYLKGVGNLFKGAMNRLIPDSWKEKAANGTGDIGQYLLGLVGAQKAGTAGANFVPGLRQALGSGSNANAEQQLNVNAAVNWLRNNAHQKSTHWCARYVRMALNRGGLDVPHGMKAQSAKYYVNILPANGWQEIPVNQAGELCDVVVIDPCTDSKGYQHPDGHIAMCIGNGVWASDFIQHSMCGLRGEPPASAVHVFRYKNRVQ